MGHTEEPGEPAAVDHPAESQIRHSESLQQPLEAFRHQRALLLDAMLSPPAEEFTDPFSEDIDYQRLFNSLPLSDMSIDCRNDSSFDLPRVINFFFRRRDVFKLFMQIFEDRAHPDRLYQTLVLRGFKAVNLKYEREERFLLLRIEDDQEEFHNRDRELRAALNPLFRERRVVLKGDLLCRFMEQLIHSERLRSKALLMEWRVDRREGSLTLSPQGSCDRDEAIGSFKLFLFSGPKKSTGDHLQEILVSLFRGEKVQVPRVLEAEFMSALKDWDLLLKLCRGRQRRRDRASGDLFMAGADWN